MLSTWLDFVVPVEHHRDQVVVGGGVVSVAVVLWVGFLVHVQAFCCARHARVCLLAHSREWPESSRRRDLRAVKLKSKIIYFNNFDNPYYIFSNR